MQHSELTEKIIGCAMRVHSGLGAGFVESVYRNALIHELQKASLSIDSRRPLTVYYDGIAVGAFEPDLLVENTVIVELKSVHALSLAHEVQLVNYLAATGLDIGLLLNFGAEKLQFKRKHRLYVSNASS